MTDLDDDPDDPDYWVGHGFTAIALLGAFSAEWSSVPPVMPIFDGIVAEIVDDPDAVRRLLWALCSELDFAVRDLAALSDETREEIVQRLAVGLLDAEQVCRDKTDNLEWGDDDE